MFTKIVFETDAVTAYSWHAHWSWLNSVRNSKNLPYGACTLNILVQYWYRFHNTVLELCEVLNFKPILDRTLLKNSRTFNYYPVAGARRSTLALSTEARYCNVIGTTMLSSALSYCLAIRAFCELIYSYIPEMSSA